ncbi:MAG TPA: indolepyruvate oxidoreductase subunit beta [bacterium]|nr:indolepyruvate oxidoreductase subunit beta [bacterium]HPJ71534.1 indolepyruvate oxidoreductase subunit beta [bacterium]HPQ65784.1 indolepyruvate oxidoreductase subunit beta [bacterium]
MNGEETVSVVLVGVGGQGILLASEIAARAALNAGFLVKTNEVHGMAQRGGSVIAQVRYGREVFSPLIEEGTARVLGSLERIEGLRYRRYLSPDGLAVVNSRAMVPVTVSMGAGVYPPEAEALNRMSFPRLIYFDASAIAEELGNIRTANVVLLGALSTGLDLPSAVWLDAVDAVVKPRHREINRRAFTAGRSLAE